MTPDAPEAFFQESAAMPHLPPEFLAAPIAHRALHDRSQGRIENSRAAVRAAIEVGYGIEIDLQLSSDGVPMVFHDDDLDRLTDGTGPVEARTAAELGRMALAGSDDTIPALKEILDLVAGRVPLLIELKDRSGTLSETDEKLERATAAALDTYAGPVAVMSFNPHSVATMAALASGVPRGLITAAFTPDHWTHVPPETRARLREIPDYARTGACFVSHEATDLDRPRVAELKAGGAAVLCWTIRNPADEAAARRIADNVTFEGYAPPKA